jgi:hypothetical protein
MTFDGGNSGTYSPIIYFSTDGGLTWSTTDPGNTISTLANPVVIQWWLDEPLQAGDADAMHRQFGFSRLRIETRKGTYDVGRLDRDYFRLDEQAWNDPGVHAALHQLDATRRILLVTSKAQPDLRMLRRTERLALKAAVLQETCTESARIGGCQALSANKLRGATVRERAALRE